MERGRGWEVDRERGEREYRQRSPRVWRHDMFEVLQKEEEVEVGDGEGEGGGWEEEEDMRNGRKRR